MPELTVGDLRSAMHTVMPEVPHIATRELSSGRSPLGHNPLAIQNALVDRINANEVKIPNPSAPESRKTLAKLEIYTMIGACGLRLHPHMIEGDGEDARFIPSIVEKEDTTTRPYELFESMLPMFRAGFDSLAANEPWAYTINGHYMKVHKTYRQATRSLRSEIDGGALPDTIHQLIRLAAKHHEPLSVPITPEELDARHAKRYEIAKQLRYLGDARAGVNIGLLGLSMELDHLRGELQTTAKQGKTITTFKRESRSNMRMVFPSSRPEWWELPMEGPTLKCPLHQIPASKEATGTVNTPKHTPVTNMLYAGLAYAYDRRNRFFVTDYERTVSGWYQPE